MSHLASVVGERVWGKVKIIAWTKGKKIPMKQP